MPLWCSTCRCRVSAPCASHQPPEDHSSFCRKFRSTKGASKARRDHINCEIRNMRRLLPISHQDQERLSYLHSMAAICTYIRKSVLLTGLPAGERPQRSLPYEAFLQALHGFILVTTAQARLVYVSENVSEYLGLSMVDVLQGDTLYDMVESSDIHVVKSNLGTDNKSSSERSFICCMQTSKTFKLQRGSSCSMMVRGRFLSFPPPGPFSSCTTSQPLFVALCTPTADQLQSCDSSPCSAFTSVHGMDMAFTQLSDSVSYFLGYTAEEMAGRSWYSLIHPEDLSVGAACHRSLMQADDGFQVDMVLRLQCKDLSWTWVYVQANKTSNCRGFTCTNAIVSETEARYLQTKITSDAFRPSNSCGGSAQQALPPQSHSGAKCLKRRRSSSSQSEEPPGTRARRESEPDLYSLPCTSCQDNGSSTPLGDGAAPCTPPYSPASSSSPLPQEDLGHDRLMDVPGYADQLLSSPEGSPIYYPRPEAGLACQLSPSDSLPAQSFDRAAFGSLGIHSPLSCSPPAYNFHTCASDARLVPDCLSATDVCEIPADCGLHQDDFCLLQQPQGGSLEQAHHDPHHVLPMNSSLLTPDQSPAPSDSHHYSKREQAEISILAQQISSLASSFTMSLQNVAETPSSFPSACDWSRRPAPLPPPKCELILDDGVFASVLTDLEMATRKSGSSGPDGAPPSSQQDSSPSGNGSPAWELEEKPLGFPPTIPEDLLPAEQFAVLDGFGLLLGHHDQSSGLHQLSLYMQSGFQRDGLAEENL